MFNSKKRINIVNLRGVIGDLGRFQKGLTIDNTSQIIERAFTHKKPHVVVININSPGGSPVQSELIYKKIRNFAEEKKVEVLTVAEDVAASGGYMLMCSGDKLFANKSSIVGSIGVISASFGFKKLIDKIGVKRRIFTKGDKKSFLDPFEDVSKKDIDKLIKVQDSIFQNFKELVSKNRKKKINPKIVFNGEFWTGEQAKEIGLVDSNDDINSYIKKTYGKKVKIRLIESKKSFIKGLVGGKIQSLDIVDQLVETIKENSLWGRYGL
jgi:signal peptide peptidase SppA